MLGEAHAERDVSGLFEGGRLGHVGDLPGRPVRKEIPRQLMEPCGGEGLGLGPEGPHTSGVQAGVGCQGVYGFTTGNTGRSTR